VRPAASDISEGLRRDGMIRLLLDIARNAMAARVVRAASELRFTGTTMTR